MKGQKKIFHDLLCYSWSKMKLCPQTYYDLFILLFIFTKIFLFSPLIKEKKWALSEDTSFTWSSKHHCFTLIGLDLGMKFSTIRLHTSVLCSAGNGWTHPCISLQNHYKNRTALLAPWGTCHSFRHKPPSWQIWWLVELSGNFQFFFAVWFFSSHSPPPSVSWSCEGPQGKNIPLQIPPVCLDLQHCNQL